MTRPDPAAARAFIQANVQPDTAALEDAVAGLVADAYASGSLALAQQKGINALPIVATAYGPAADLASYWDSWTPGSADAAALLDNGGLADLLAQADITIKGIAGTTLDRLGTLLANGAAAGDSVETISRSLMDLLDDPVRAMTIANTEVARAVSTASLDTYGANGIEQWDWVLSPGACDECVDMEGDNPHPLDDDHPPLHPNCRCAAAPVLPEALAGQSLDDLSAEGYDTSDFEDQPEE